ncbi:MAG: prepilin-type N-terminal cleavage/methylation domain-containing protein [Candidatus Omnitrophota bacterium]|nr:MAG: prepilin-type N-terminal cleavage/methylation domain-containing protein [Candidatus Omnitrophota bacterium]
MRKINSGAQRGFSLVELIVSVAVLSLGIVIICQGLLVTLGGFNYCIDYLNVLLWIDEKVWDIQDKLIHYRTLLTYEDSGTFILRNKHFDWNLSYDLTEGAEKASLYEITLTVSWREGMKRMNISRSAYVLFLAKDT